MCISLIPKLVCSTMDFRKLTKNWKLIFVEINLFLILKSICCFSNWFVLVSSIVFFKTKSRVYIFLSSYSFHTLHSWKCSVLTVSRILTFKIIRLNSRFCYQVNTFTQVTRRTLWHGIICLDDALKHVRHEYAKQDRMNKSTCWPFVMFHSDAFTAFQSLRLPSSQRQSHWPIHSFDQGISEFNLDLIQQATPPQAVTLTFPLNTAVQ